jgi:hypothetical protein
MFDHRDDDRMTLNERLDETSQAEAPPFKRCSCWSGYQNT